MNSVAEVANSTNVILTCLPDAGALGEVSSGEGGIVANPQDGLVLFEMSSMEPEAKVFDYFPVCYQKLNIFLITLR